MDEFFDFEGAANTLGEAQPDYSNDPTHNYDIDLAFAEAGRDEDAFLCLAHFTKDAPDHQIYFDLHAPPISQNSRMATDESTGFPAWLDDRDIPRLSCAYCTEKGFHCKTIRDGSRKGSCTSCVALDHKCSFLTNVSPSDSNAEHESSPATDALRHISPSDGAAIKSSNSSTSDLEAPRFLTDERHHDAEPQVKSGARFSRESLRVLRAWLGAHHRLPYPTDEDKESLKRQTGLSKTQISNWIANARRRGKVRAPRTVSPGPTQLSNPIDIPRRSTPAPRDAEEMNPLERWEHSPPEHEAADVNAIANAVSSSTFNNGRGSPYYGNSDSESGRARSVCKSSTSGFGTSASSGESFASAFSYDSRNSFGSLGSIGVKGRRRRGQRRQITKTAQAFLDNHEAPRKFQCTFCTETFKTKHDWQRHEKTLHLSLERWICAPHGPTAPSKENGIEICAFCGDSTPDEAHLEFHNYRTCADRSLEERTFYRKDHLRQHLLLVHDTKFGAWSMDAWKVETPPIQSRCGFCDITMDTWAQRVDHLAKHFKSGKTMADWKGEWGFEPHVAAVVENGMPPYLIHYDRSTLRPYEASKESHDMTRLPYDLIKMGLVDFINELVASGAMPTDEQLLGEARQIYKSLDSTAKGARYRGVSWFRDLFMTGTQHIGPKNSERANLMGFKSDPKCGGGVCCPNETKLKNFVASRTALGAPPNGPELQNEACKILEEAERNTTFPCQSALSWFRHLIRSSTDWLEDFRRRVNLPLQSELDEGDTSLANGFDAEIYNLARLEKELIEYVNLCSALGSPPPTDADLRRQARNIVFGSDDDQFQTAADNPEWLTAFKHHFDHTTNAIQPRPVDFLQPILPVEAIAAHENNNAFITGMSSSAKISPDVGVLQVSSTNPTDLHWDMSGFTPTMWMPAPAGESTGRTTNYNPLANTMAPFASPTLPIYPQKGNHAFNSLTMYTSATNSSIFKTSSPAHGGTCEDALTFTTSRPSSVAPRNYFFSDANCYRRLMHELARFVASCMSPNNPNPYTPTDEEIQRQARWITYDDDDPWNQTAADNAEWLLRFKQDIGLIGPGEDTGVGLGENDLGEIPIGIAGISDETTNGLLQGVLNQEISHSEWL